MKFCANSCACGASKSTAMFPIADWNFGNTTETGEMRRCSRCGSLFPDRFPDAETLPVAYESYYTVPRQRSGWRRWRRRILDAFIGDAYLSRDTPASARSLLDYGCGSGEFLETMRKRHSGIAVAGTDVTLPGPIERLPFEWVALDAIGEGDRRYDWITLSHVIEHVNDPHQTIAALARSIAPGGALWISTPNADSFLFGALRGRARDADFPRHRQIYSRRGLTLLLETAGLSVTFQPAPWINSILNLATGLANLRQPPEGLDADPVPSWYRAVLRTVGHQLSSSSSQDRVTPELVAIARVVKKP